VTIPPLTPAEQAAAEAIRSASPNAEWLVPDDFADEARAVVAAVRSQIESDALDAFADAAAEYGPASADHLRLAAWIVRQGRTTVRDWLANDSALSRPTSEETR
jgi:hypothetical protein